MSSITELLQDLIYPALYNNIAEALPDFRFKKIPGDRGYKAMSGVKIDGSIGEAEKVFIYANNISRIVDFTRGSVSVWDYIQQRDSLTNQETLITLAEMAGVKLPERVLSEEELERMAYFKKSAEIWEALNSFLIDCLSSKESEIALSNDADRVRKYLTNSRDKGGRGLLPTDFRMPGVAFDKEANLVEFGFMPEPTVAYKYLLSKGYEEADLRKILRLTEDGRIGKDGYYLTLPYRDGSGSIRGLIIRNIQFNNASKNKAPKYLFTKSLEGVKGSLLYNLKPLVGDKGLLIVESQIDAAIASVKGLDNVVAIGGKIITEAQIKQALKKRPKSFTILLDNERETIAQIKSTIYAILSQDENAHIFIAHIDRSEIKDLEEYLVACGVEAFKANVLNNKTPYWRYLLNTIIQEYGAKEKDNQLSPEDEEAFLEEVVRTANKIKSPIDRERYNKLFTSLEPVKEMGISLESLTATQDKLSYKADKEAQAKDFKKLLSEVTQLQDKGEVSKALELLDSKVKEVKLKDRATEFSGLLLPIKEEELKQRQTNKPDSLNSGYTIGGEELLLPAGAISIFTAPTSHGKTTFLVNLALNVAQAYPDKEAYLFSYEEDGDSVLINALNTYLDEEISSNNRRTLKSYFSTGSTEYIKSHSKDYFTATKDKFFRELIDTRRLNIHYSSYNSDTIIEAIRYLNKNANPGAIFIDYIQLLNLPEGKYKTYSRQEEIKEICIALKDMAVETGLPIILGAQFNREVVNQLRLHPTKIGEAGDIERIANLIVGFWNNNFKPLASDGELNEINNKGASTPDTLFTTILKNRGGKVGAEEILSFNGNTGKIKNSSNSGSSYFK
jgi:DNA primase